MADNSARTPGSGENIRSIDRSAIKTQVTALDAGGAGAESLVALANGLPTRPALPLVAALTSASINAAASGDNTLIAGTAAQTIRVHRLFLIAAGAVNLKFRDGTAGTDLTAAMMLMAGGGMTLDFDSEPWFVTTTANAFVLNLSAAIQVSGRIYYTKS